MGAINVDPVWIADYAKRVSGAAGELDQGVALLNTAPLGPDAFGELGRTVRTTDAYLRAAETLREQLTRGAAALQSASRELTRVAEQYQASDDDGAVSLRKSGGE